METFKTQGKKATEKVAVDLLKLQAMRKSMGGHAFLRDTDWRKEFEDTFQYRQTPDQEKAIEDTKTDMEAPYAMDRLLCGDVGYGKTEVAMRAAFKCVMDNKQVAFLVPTTVLAEQHYQNFIKRIGSFPVKVEMLSRFKTHSEQKAITQAIRQGSVDIAIG
ncbi:MAG TPA: DEAD/DEAH box helicase, partial [Candidatus Omnitrophota bacterium]|nr:DEAD/DEAH box helicase [Candidatus Omnitrophota bacterium]